MHKSRVSSDGSAHRAPISPLHLCWLPILLLSAGSVVAVALVALKASVEGDAVEGNPTALVIPRSLADLRGSVVIVRTIAATNPALSLISVSVVYLFVKAFCLPGAMLCNALIGCAWGVELGVPLIVVLSASGAGLNYVLSQAFGAAIIARWRLEERIWPVRMRVEAARKAGSLLSAMTAARLMPGIPHWLLNLAAPHCGVPIGLFLASTALGMLPHNCLTCILGASIATLSWEDVFSWHALLGLALLSVVVAVPALVTGTSVGRRLWSKRQPEATRSHPLPEDAEASLDVPRELADDGLDDDDNTAAAGRINTSSFRSSWQSCES